MIKSNGRLFDLSELNYLKINITYSMSKEIASKQGLPATEECMSQYLHFTCWNEKACGMPQLWEADIPVKTHPTPIDLRTKGRTVAILLELISRRPCTALMMFHTLLLLHASPNQTTWHTPVPMQSSISSSIVANDGFKISTLWNSPLASAVSTSRCWKNRGFSKAQAHLYCKT